MLLKYLTLACAVSACAAFHIIPAPGGPNVIKSSTKQLTSNNFQKPHYSTRRSITRIGDYFPEKNNPLHSIFNPARILVRKPAPQRASRISRLEHDKVTFRTRVGGEKFLSIPQAERYTTQDWLHNLRTIPSSLLIQRIRQPLLVTMGWTCVVTAALHAFPAVPALSPKAHTFVSSALSLLLVFRTNAAYNRFWEGRQIWQKVLDCARSLARYLTLYAEELGDARRKRVANLVCAFPIVLQEHLQGGEKPHRTEYFLEAEDYLELGRASNRPLCLVNKIAKVVKGVEYSAAWTSRERLALLALVNSLSDTIGACERLVQTPVPLAYTRHTNRFLSLWVLSLPLTLAGDMGWGAVPAMGLVAWALFGIQEIGLTIEDPFRRALKLEVIADTIYADVIQTMGSRDVLPTYLSTPFFANFPAPPAAEAPATSG
mmetsp:Transcript_7280/g.11207  ORF Transcript_7280/g.11207 Transcript_7280/m.11207 type:complete len:430 (-) Transcript_7280:453-1742(-)